MDLESGLPVDEEEDPSVEGRTQDQTEEQLAGPSGESAQSCQPMPVSSSPESSPELRRHNLRESLSARRWSARQAARWQNRGNTGGEVSADED